MELVTLIALAVLVNLVTGGGLVATAFKGYEISPLTAVTGTTLYAATVIGAQILLGDLFFTVPKTTITYIVVAGAVGAGIGASIIAAGFRPSNLYEVKENENEPLA